MKNWLLLINLTVILVLLGASCNKKTQKSTEPKNQVEQKKDSSEHKEVHAPKSDAPVEINKKKQEQTEKKYQNTNPPTEEKSK